MKKLFHLIAVFCLATTGSTALAQTRLLSLDDAIAMTVTENPMMAAAAAQERAATAQRRAAIGLRMPQISLTGTYAYLSNDIAFDLNDAKGPVGDFTSQLLASGLVPAQSIPSILELTGPMMAADWSLQLQPRSFATLGGQVTMPLWMGGKINAANRAARLEERTALAQRSQTRQTLISEVVERYFGLALALQVVEVRKQVVEGVSHHLKDARALERNGMLASSERLYVEFKMAEAERELENARLEAQTIASALQNTLGTSEVAQPATAMFVVVHIEPLDYFRQSAVDHNPLLQQVALKRELAHEGVRAQRGEFYPQVVAIGGASLANYQVSGLLPRWAVGVGVNFKIFDGLNREYKYSAAKQTERRVAELHEKAESDMAVRVEQLYNQLQSYSNRMASIEASLTFAEEYLRMKQASFREGMTSSSDLIDAELNLAKVRAERLQAAYMYDTLLAQLLEAAGLSDAFPAYAHRGDARQILFK